ncbi:MAG: hypothetical protein CSYNP_00950 [Syntrophus sp. SKADARSKE-3]|nr:hypothetical protein [Syntrophus sp. SKADARSKE-3]
MVLDSKFKIPYEPPRIIDLAGGTAHAQTISTDGSSADSADDGKNCRSGSVAIQQCMNGSVASQNQCKSGSTAGKEQCQAGGSPGNHCQSGSTAYGGKCQSGSVASQKCWSGSMPGA